MTIMNSKKYIFGLVIFAAGVITYFLHDEYVKTCIKELEPYGSECIKTRDFKYCFPTISYNQMEICNVFDAFQYMEENCYQGQLNACEALITGYSNKGDITNMKKWNIYACELAKQKGVESSFECK